MEGKFDERTGRTPNKIKADKTINGSKVLRLHRGYYGIIKLVKEKSIGKLFAMKSISKQKLHKVGSVEEIIKERKSY